MDVGFLGWDNGSSQDVLGFSMANYSQAQYLDDHLDK